MQVSDEFIALSLATRYGWTKNHDLSPRLGNILEKLEELQSLCDWEYWNVVTVEESRIEIHCDVETQAVVFILNCIFQCKEPLPFGFLRLIAVTKKRDCFVWLRGYPDYQYPLYTDMDDR